jgi:Fe-S oxidoreductase
MFDVRAHSLPHNAYSACTGCSLCLLVCPVWRKSHDIRLTPHGRAKALQHGATIADITESIESCTLCGACEPACP